MAGKEKFAMAAGAGQFGAFAAAKLVAFKSFVQRNQVGFLQVAQFVFGCHVVIAGIDVAVALHGQGLATGFVH